MQLLEKIEELTLYILSQQEEMERLRVRGARTDGETLMHPRGLGDCRVLIARI